MSSFIIRAKPQNKPVIFPGTARTNFVCSCASTSLGVGSAFKDPVGHLSSISSHARSAIMWQYSFMELCGKVCLMNAQRSSTTCALISFWLATLHTE